MNTNHQPTVIHCFERLIQKNNQTGGADKTRGFKNRAHKKVIEDLLTNFDDNTTPLTDIKQLNGRSGYGKGTIERISEIIHTGTLKELDDAATTDPHTIAMAELLCVTGVGPVKAKKLVEQGGTLKILQDAIAQDRSDVLNPFKLTAHQKMGLKYSDDLSHRIPQSIIQQFDVLLQAECRKKHIPCKAVICGSYRRGKADSGDIDILLTREDWEDKNQAAACLQIALKHLSDKAILVDHLTSTTTCKTKYMGFLRIPGYPYACRVDIRAVVFVQYVTALAYFTGSGEENVRLRRIASKKKMKLNEYGLTCIDTGKLHPLQSEEHLYEALDEPYVPPSLR